MSALTSPRMQRDFETMSNPDHWPGTTLCLKRYVPPSGIEFAQLYQIGDDQSRQFEFIPDEGEHRKGGAMMLQLLIAEKWLVD